MKALVHSLCEFLDCGETVMMATIVESAGSTPRMGRCKPLLPLGKGTVL
ncbi:MAG: hypothetical protein ABIK45_11250 [Pseudomonadota bacterium]